MPCQKLGFWGIQTSCCRMSLYTLTALANNLSTHLQVNKPEQIEPMSLLCMSLCQVRLSNQPTNQPYHPWFPPRPPPKLCKGLKKSCKT